MGWMDGKINHRSNGRRDECGEAMDRPIGGVTKEAMSAAMEGTLDQ